MASEFENLRVDSETFEPFVLCLALGTLRAIKEGVWPPKAGIWTIGRPNFIGEVERMKLSDDTIDILVLFDELSALEEFAGDEELNAQIENIEAALTERLRAFSDVYWHAEWQ